MIRYYILAGHMPLAVDPMTWARWFEDPACRIIKQERIGDILVSTVFLGIDHNFWRSGPPPLFETIIFGGRHDGYQERCATWHDAEAQHERARSLVLETPVIAAG
jgi:hypothetical protein